MLHALLPAEKFRMIGTSAQRQRLTSPFMDPEDPKSLAGRCEGGSYPSITRLAALRVCGGGRANQPPFPPS
jgi:hypothetical protein